ncbi:MAG: glycine cleavage system protein H [Acidobacteria bacterium]|nr:glycine cleavage system protein H [Acidobacteriota bacterium]
MAVLLVLATFLVFVVVDYFMGSKKKVVETAAPEQAPAPATLLSSSSIEGILVPDQLRYHPGHTWLMEEQSKVARVGADALAVSVMGPVDKIELPKIGRWVRQGQKSFAFYSGPEKIELASPAEGEVVEINPAVVKDPKLAIKDPYGAGWLVKVSVPERDTVLRNLLPQSLVRGWMKEEVRRVRAAIPMAKVAVMGGGASNPPAGSGKKISDLFL